MRTSHSPVLKLLAFVIATQVIPALAQVTPAAAPSAADRTDSEKKLDRVEILGNSVGLRQTRANVKITEADLDYYPPGVSADKVLERVTGIQTGSSNAFGGDGFESTINMRGFGKDSIGFSIDGVPNGRTTLGGGSVPTRYFDSSNLAGVDVSQSAGVIGAPSNQALVGHVNYLTQDPLGKFGFRGEAALGSADYWRSYARVDTGELLPGVTSYLNVSRQNWKVSYVDNPAGHNTRDHVDLKVVADMGKGSKLKFFTGFNDRKEESGTNIVTLAQFNKNPKLDGYTDQWTGVPATDRNYRGLKGNPRRDSLSYLDYTLPLGDALSLNAKAYYHHQEGVGKEAALGNGGFPGLDGKASSIYFRGNNYDMNRRGVLAELAGKHSALIDWRVGGWFETYNRSQVRGWYPVLDESAGPQWSSVADTFSEDKHWQNTVHMGYAANRSTFMGGRLKLDYGFTYLANSVDYRAPIQDSKTAKFNFVNEAKVNSGLLPKIGGVYSITQNTEVYAGYAKNAASVTDATLEGGAAATLAAAQTVREMDTANAFDVGLRHKGENFVAGIQAFSIRSKETVASDIVGTLQSENVQQGRRIRGVEMTFNGRMDNWRLYSSLTLQRHAYVLTGADAAGYPVKGFIRDGADLVGIASRNFFTEVTYTPTESIKLAMNARFTGSRAGYYANPRVAGSGVDERLPAYAVFGARGSYSLGRGSVGVNVENVANKKYIAGIAPELMTSPSTVGRYFIGAPRTFVLWGRIEL